MVDEKADAPMSNKYVIDFHNMAKGAVLGSASTGQGAAFNGERIYCALVTKKTGTGSKPHFHPDETFNYTVPTPKPENSHGL